MFLQQPQQQKEEQCWVEEDKENNEKLEAKLKKKREKRKTLAEKNEGLKASMKKKKKPADEKALWNRLRELNENFVNIKNIQKQNKNNFFSVVKNIFYRKYVIFLNKFNCFKTNITMSA